MNTETEAVKDEIQITPGLLLKQKRESLGLSQKQIAGRLRLRVAIVEALEQDNFNIDKVTTFTRGYVRSYAKVVGLEERVILDAYDKYCGVRTETPFDLDMRSFSKKTKRQQHNNRVNFISVIVVLVLIGISSVWWYQNQQQDSLMPGNESSYNSDLSADSVLESSNDDLNVQSATVSETTDNEQQAKVEQDIAPVQLDADNDHAIMNHDSVTDATDTEASATESNATEDVALPDDSAEETVSQSDKAEQTPAVTSSLVVMSFSADCWVSVKDATGKTLSIGLKQPGKTLHLRGQQPFTIVLGAPEYVSLTFAGKQVDLSRYASGKVARLTLP